MRSLVNRLITALTTVVLSGACRCSNLRCAFVYFFSLQAIFFLCDFSFLFIFQGSLIKAENKGLNMETLFSFMF